MVGDVDLAATFAARALGWQPLVAKGGREEEGASLPGRAISGEEQVVKNAIAGREEECASLPGRTMSGLQQLLKAGAPEHCRNLVLSKGGRGQRTETELLVLSGIEKCRNVFVDDIVLGRLARRQIIAQCTVWYNR